LGTLSPEEIHAAQVISGTAMIALLLAGFSGRFAQRLRIGAAVLYFVAAAVFVAYVLTR
jgi:hypothetical protein